MTHAAPQAARLPTAALFCYGLPALPLAALLLPIFMFLPAHYATLGLSLTTIGTVLLLARLWDGIADPVAGWLSDRTRSRFGRRKPWIAAGLPLTMMALWQLLAPSGAVDALYLLGWSFALYLGWTMINVPFNAWGAELSDDYHERTRISGFREAAGVIGTVVALTLPFAFGASSAEAAGQALRIMAVFLLMALPLAVGLALFFTPDRPSHPPLVAGSDGAVSPASGGETGFWRGARAIAGNAPFRRLIAAYLINGVANAMPAQLFLFFVQYRLTTPEMAGLALLAYFATSLLGVPLWLKLSRRFGKHRVWCAAMLWNMGWFALTLALGPGDIWPFIVICCLTGAALGADLILPASMQADVIDQDALAAGAARAGIYFALWGLVTKLATALAAFGLTALDLVGFKPQPGNDAVALWGLALLYAGVPIAFKAAAVALLWRWPLTEAAQRTRTA
jgi:glycoside/pentoside/hexuronide:cation symporter, GPH family